MSVAPVVRVRFLVALIIVFGVLASAAGAVAVERTRAAQSLQDLLDAQDVVQQVDWPDGVSRGQRVEGCVSTARSVCLSSDLPTRATALAVANALRLPESSVRRRTEPKDVLEARGTVGSQTVVVLVKPRNVPASDGTLEVNGAIADIWLPDAADVPDDADWRASSTPVT